MKKLFKKLVLAKPEVDNVPAKGGLSKRIRNIKSIWHNENQDDIGIEKMLRLFMKNRWGGIYPILNGAQAREAALDEWIYHSTFSVDDLPVTELPRGAELPSATRHPAPAPAGGAK